VNLLQWPGRRKPVLPGSVSSACVHQQSNLKCILYLWTNITLCLKIFTNKRLVVNVFSLVLIKHTYSTRIALKIFLIISFYFWTSSLFDLPDQC
jgi:hypothetical protein